MKKLDAHGREILTIGSGYIRDAVFARNPEIIISEAREELRGVNFDSMIGTGLSGSLVIPILAAALNVPWAIVRKQTENSHADSLIEGNIGSRWLFVDDFISSGATKSRVCEAVKKVAENYYFTTIFVGTYMYARSRGSRFVQSPHPEA